MGDHPVWGDVPDMSSRIVRRNPRRASSVSGTSGYVRRTSSYSRPLSNLSHCIDVSGNTICDVDDDISEAILPASHMLGSDLL